MAPITPSISSLFLCLLMLVFAGVSTKAQSPVEITYDNGLSFKSADSNYSFGLGGRIHYDFAFLHPDEQLATNIFYTNFTTELRRVRLYFKGDLYQNTGFKLQIEYSDNKVSLKDVYLEHRNIPVIGAIRVGQFKEPMRLEVLASSNNITFMERSPLASISPERNLGVGFYNSVWNNRLTYSAGAFFEKNVIVGSGNALGGYAGTARLTALPYYNENGNLLHLGLSGSYRTDQDKVYTILLRPEAHLAPVVAGSGSISQVENEQFLNVELAAIYGRAHFQSEVSRIVINTANFGDELYTYYWQAGMFLFGGKPAYKYKQGILGKPELKQNAKGKYNALELALRYSAADMQGEHINGTSLNTIDFGFNWYLNPACRIALNHSYSMVEARGNIHVTQTRLQLVF